MLTIIYFIAGLVLLIAGAELLVRGASKIAGALGIPSLIIGLTIVAFGTSSPELAISVKGALSGQADIALGNVIGSNIFNVLFILGLSALIIPLTVSRQLIRFDVPVLIFISFALLLMAWDHILSFTDGVLMITALAGYIGFLIYSGLRTKQNNTADEPEIDSAKPKWSVNFLMIASGLALLIIGSGWLVDSAIVFARYLGVSELIIGLTIIAAGTSLPEVVTSVVAAFKGERDIAVGNVVGSNILNIMAVLGISVIVSPNGIAVSDAIIAFDLPFMVAVSIACLPIFFTGGIINRWEGSLFIAYYIAYSVYLFLNASQHDLLNEFNVVMIYFVVPITIITIIVTVLGEFKKNREISSEA